MKFAVTLDQRSIPEWRAYNLDYRDIKTVIKRQTTVHSPVDEPHLSPEYENELFNILVDQLDRINLFVKSKTGEIKSRLVSFRRQLAVLKKRASGRAASKAATRYAKLELEIERAANDIQRLARYIILQHTGFRKLLKKYRKWSGSDCLPQRFGVLLDSPNAFHNQNFEQLVMEVSDLLTAVRAGVNTLAEDGEDSSPTARMAALSPARNARPELQRTGTPSSSILVASVPQGPNKDSGRAVFWVHSDYVIELQFLLLRHLTIQSSSPSSSRNPTPALSRTPSSHSVVPGKDDETIMVALDDPRFAKQSAYNSEASKEAAALVTWKTQSPEARISTSRGSGSDSELVIKKKYAESIIRPHIHGVNIPCKDAVTENRVKDMQDWFLQHQEMKPLAKTWFRRTRFVGQTPSGHAWAFLDRDIKTRALNGASGWATDEPAGGDDVAFPHAICEVRWDGDMIPAVIEEIKHNHMVKEVDGFSLEVHAMITACCGIESSPWNEILRQGFQLAAPPLDRRNSRRSSDTSAVRTGYSSKNSSATGGTVDTVLHESSATSDGAYADMESRASRNKRRLRRKKRAVADIKNITGQRYWNELEGDGSDNEGQAPFTILVAGKSDEDDEEDVSLSAYIMGSVTRTLKSAGNALKFQRAGGDVDENSNLLGDGPYQAYADSSSDEEGRQVDRSRGYGTYRGPTRRRNRRMQRHILFMFVSFVFFVFGGAIALEDSLNGKKRRRRDEAESLLFDFGVLSCLLVSLGFAVLGLTMFLMGSRTATWVHTCLVWVSFVAIMAGDGAVVGLLGRTELGE